MRIHGTVNGFKDGSTSLLRSEATIRTFNNSFYDALLQEGGTAIFSTSTNTAYAAAEKRIIKAVDDKIMAMEEQLQGLEALSGEYDLEGAYKYIVGDCLRKGHAEIVNALQRVSGLPVVNLQHLP